MTHVPYRGSAPALAGHDRRPPRPDLRQCHAGAAAREEAAGARGLAVTTAKRVRGVPELPTIAEAGVPGFDVSSWFAFFVPAKTPPEIVKKMHDDTVAALAHPAVKERLGAARRRDRRLDAGGARRLPQVRDGQMGPVIREAKIKIERVGSRHDRPPPSHRSRCRIRPRPGAQRARRRSRRLAWPRRFVRLVVPFPAGGGTDAVARIVANRLSEVWGQQMVIENKGGAGSNIGAEAVARVRARRLHGADRLAAAGGQSLSSIRRSTTIRSPTSRRSR